MSSPNKVFPNVLFLPAQDFSDSFPSFSSLSTELRSDMQTT